MTSTRHWQTIRALRTVGFAAWLRTPEQGNWDHQIHAMAISNPNMALVGANQVADCYVGRNGLVSHANDNTPTSYRVPFTWCERYVGL